MVSASPRAGKPENPDHRTKFLPPSRLTGSFPDPFVGVIYMAYAIIQSGGRQFRVEPGDVVDVELLEVEPGKKTVFEEVLLAADESGVKIGEPLVKGAKVTAEVVEQRKGPKLVSYKFRRRKGYHRTVGHRQKLTRVKVGEIKL